MPDLIADAPSDLTIYERSICTGETTPISELLQPDMGCVFWASCTNPLPIRR
jgi:hypothetical protein